MTTLETHRLFLAALAFFPFFAWATAYSGTETMAQVVDAETQQPLEGVNVVAHWVLKYGITGSQSADLMLMETVTDRNGQFHLPAWGPEAVPAHLPGYTYMGGQDPEVILFKRGYQPSWLSNGTSGPQQGSGPPVRTWGWNGKTLELKKFKGDQKKYGSLIGGVLTGVGYGGCEWKKIPRVIVALNKEAERLKSEGIYSYTVVRPSIAELEAATGISKCGPVSEYLRTFQ